MAVLRFSIKNKWIGLLFGAALAFFVFIWAKELLDHLVRSSLIDPRFVFDYGTLVEGDALLGDSPGVLRRLSEKESFGVRSAEEKSEIFALSLKHISRAIELMPKNYELYLQKGILLEQTGQPEEAGRQFEKAVELAPNFSDASWARANFLLRQKQSVAGANELARAVSLDPELAGSAFDLLWQIFENDPAPLRQLVADCGKLSPAESEKSSPMTGNIENLLRVKLAAFFSRTDPAQTVLPDLLSGIEPKDFQAIKDSRFLVDNLLERDRGWLARRIVEEKVYGQTKTNRDEPEELISNGGFEKPSPPVGFRQFDWRFNRSEYASAFIEVANSGGARSGENNLLVRFSGKDTTRLEKEIGQMVALRAGQRYRFRFFYKTSRDFFLPGDEEVLRKPPGNVLPLNFNSGRQGAPGSNREAPLRLILRIPGGKTLLETAPLMSTSGEWKELVYDFKTDPAEKISGELTAELYLYRKPRYSFEKPVRGELRFDDFSLTETK